MIVLTYPNHITVCEPTPHKTDLPIGRMPPGLNHANYEVTYLYIPKK